MLQMDNKTPFETMLGLFPDENGIDTVYPVLKGTFVLGNRLRLADKQEPIVTVDEYVGEPGVSSLRRASEMTLMKPTTDVLLYGHAHAPGGIPATQVDVGVRVGQLAKMARVFGDRIWLPRAMGFAQSNPQPFLKIPLTYERCFGGTDQIGNDRVAMVEENPVGSGYHHPRGSREIAGMSLPNVEDLGHLISSVDDAPKPHGFGALCPGWLPRRRFAGTYDDVWQQNRAPFLPKDFDTRFLNCAPPGLVSDTLLVGGEDAAVQNVDPNGRIEFKLPAIGMRITVTIDREAFTHQPVLDTVIIDADLQTLSIVWRCKQQCDKKSLAVEMVSFELLQTDPAIDGM